MKEGHALFDSKRGNAGAQNDKTSLRHTRFEDLM